jgi:glucose-6-phosphate dehydrogenase assembly protein OpcA
VSEDIWAAQDTTPDAVEAALRELLRQRHAANRALAPARVLNLVVVVARDWKGEVANRLERVGRYHASRTILCAFEPRREVLDAVAVMDYQESEGPGLSVMHERVEIDIGPRHLARLDTIVDPVLVSELPTMLWSPHGHEQAVTRLLPMVDVILIDSDDQEDARAALGHAAKLLESVYVVDLAWLRTTPWRERLAASFDPPRRRAALTELNQVAIRHHASSRASAALLAGWLAARLRWNGSAPEVEVAAVDQETPGLAGVTVSWGGSCSLSLDRGRGGLIARELTGGAESQSWLVLGASRGEGGILGEGVRQALLRDPTYAPALACARGICP